MLSARSASLAFYEMAPYWVIGEKLLYLRYDE